MSRSKTVVTERGDNAPMLVNAAEACRLLGGISKKTLRRLEERGLVRSVKLIRHRLFPRDQITSLVANLQTFRP